MNINTLKYMSFFLPMPKGRDEVKTAVDPVVYNVSSV